MLQQMSEKVGRCVDVSSSSPVPTVSLFSNFNETSRTRTCIQMWV